MKQKQKPKKNNFWSQLVLPFVRPHFLFCFGNLYLFVNIFSKLFTVVVMETAVLSVRVKKSLKEEAEKMGIDIKPAVEALLEKLVAEKKAKAQKRAEELRRAMGNVTVEEWVRDIKQTRREM
jgi:antitoxin component of RelBE/YafQ-DinJ toxin-antitoxin module